MSGEPWGEQLRRLKRGLAEIGEDPGPAARAPRQGEMPLTRAHRLAILEDVRRAQGLQPGQPLRQLLGYSPPARGDVRLEPAPVWVHLETGRRVMAKERPPGCAALCEVSKLIGGA